MTEIVKKLSEKLNPMIGLAQLMLVVALLTMAIVFVMRTLGGLQLSAVPRFDWTAVAVVAGVVYVLS